jgi:DNA ligase-associated metallophosphoesterase
VPESIDIQLAGFSFQLLADYGLFWPDQSMLFVADTHLGKDATFRRGGIPVPTGATDATLARISKMLRRTCAARFCILGDMLHAKSSIATDVRKSLENFFLEFSSVQMTLVLGNHDTRVGALPRNWPIEVLNPRTLIDSVAIGHHPSELPPGAQVYLCGHVHPAIRISSRSERLGKLPCFWHSRGQVVLPAIGEFTGTHVVTLAAEDNAWIVADNQIYAYR